MKKPLSSILSSLEEEMAANKKETDKLEQSGQYLERELRDMEKSIGEVFPAAVRQQ